MDISVTTSSSPSGPPRKPKGYREITTGWDCDRCGAQIAPDRIAAHDAFHERVEPPPTPEPMKPGIAEWPAQLVDEMDTWK